MSTVDQESVEIEASGLGAVGRHWGLLLTFGLVSLVIGILALVSTAATVVAVAILLAAWLLVTGIFQIIRGFSRGLSGGMRALLFISGGLSFILGLIAISGIWDAIEILAIFVAISLLFQGFGTLFTAGDAGGSKGWDIFGGILMLIGGFVVLMWPMASLGALAIVIGIALIVSGIFMIIGAFRLRSLLKAA